MSKIYELIAQLCPDGVSFKRLNEISEMKRGTSITKKDIVEGDIPVISGGRMPAYYCNSYNRDGETITVAGSGAGAGYVQYWNQPIFVCDAFSVKGKEYVTTKYLYYCLSNMQEYIYSTKKGGGVPHVHISNIENVMLPVPPLEVQREIVRILDSFTLLTAELIAELTARKKQYDFYRDKLLDIKGNKYVLEDVCQIADCPHTSPKWKEEGIPVIRNYNLIDGNIDTTMLSYVDEEEYKNRVKRIIPREGDILFSREAPIGNVGIIPKGFICCQGQRVVLLRPNQQIVCPQFLSYVLQGSVVRRQIEKVEAIGSTVSNFNISDLKKLQFELPSIEEQEIIAERLNAFSKICVDKKQGLPAEIAARQKQYEYYVRKLLAFKEKVG